MNTSEVDMDLVKVQEIKIFEHPCHNQQICDITLVSADEYYKANVHKSILASASKYFLAMFEGSLRESKADEVKLNQINGQTLKAICDFIYKKAIKLKPDTVDSVLVGSDILDIKPLKKICIDYMNSHLDKTNCLEISKFAKYYNLHELYTPAMLFACEHFVELQEEPTFLSCYVDQLCELISSDDLRMPSEENVVLAIKDWVDYRRDERGQFLKRLLSHVRFPFLTPKCIVKYTEIFPKSPEILQIFRNALEWHKMDPNKRANEFTPEQCKIRNLNDVIALIKGCGDKDSDLYVELYYSGLGEWIYTKWPPLPNSSKNVKYTMLGKRLIVTDRNAKAVDCFNLETLTWSEFPELPTPNTKAIMTSDGTIYAIDGKWVHVIEKPFKKWSTIEGTPFEDIECFTAYNKIIYFPNGEYFYTYDPVNKVCKKGMKRQHAVTCKYLHILRHIDSDFLFEVEHLNIDANISKVKAYLIIYNLSTNQLVKKIPFPPGGVMKEELYGLAIVVDTRYGYIQFNICKKQVRCLPNLSYHQMDFNMLLGNSSNI